MTIPIIIKEGSLSHYAGYAITCDTCGYQPQTICKDLDDALGEAKRRGWTLTHIPHAFGAVKLTCNLCQLKQ